jgi:hypothetical protein
LIFHGSGTARLLDRSNLDGRYCASQGYGSALTLKISSDSTPKNTLELDAPGSHSPCASAKPVHWVVDRGKGEFRRAKGSGTVIFHCGGKHNFAAVLKGKLHY